VGAGDHRPASTTASYLHVQGQQKANRRDGLLSYDGNVRSKRRRHSAEQIQGRGRCEINALCGAAPTDQVSGARQGWERGDDAQWNLLFGRVAEADAMKIVSKYTNHWSCCANLRPRIGPMYFVLVLVLVLCTLWCIYSAVSWENRGMAHRPIEIPAQTYSLWLRTGSYRSIHCVP
jgi:hypothetical protein